MGGALPKPVHRGDEYMVALCQRQDATNELLGQILDRLPAPVELTVGGESGEIQISEPAVSTPPADESVPVAITEPAAPARKVPAKAVKAAPKTPARPAAKKGTSNG